MFRTLTAAFALSLLAGAALAQADPYGLPPGYEPEAGTTAQGYPQPKEYTDADYATGQAQPGGQPVYAYTPGAAEAYAPQSGYAPQGYAQTHPQPQGYQAQVYVQPSPTGGYYNSASSAERAYGYSASSSYSSSSSSQGGYYASGGCGAPSPCGGGHGGGYGGGYGGGGHAGYVEDGRGGYVAVETRGCGQRCGGGGYSDTYAAPFAYQRRAEAYYQATGQYESSWERRGGYGGCPQPTRCEDLANLRLTAGFEASLTGGVEGGGPVYVSGGGGGYASSSAYASAGARAGAYAFAGARGRGGKGHGGKGHGCGCR